MQHSNVAGTFLAHSKNRDDKSPILHEHLQSVGDMAAQFAEHMHPALTDAAKWAGLLHDLGKYRNAFQQYLRCERQGSVETHHAIYGAALAFQRKWLGPALAIAGHHAGLHNLFELRNDLLTDMKYHTKEQLPAIIERFESEVCAIVERVSEPEFVRNNKFSTEFYIRMLFSGLVDADFLDTEAHYALAPSVTPRLQPDDLLQRLMAEEGAKPHDGELSALRHRIFQQCLDAADHAPGFFSLTVPTGGGKTLASMAFALRHAERHALRRVIVVIPYLSIIEQNAA
jgi:CRISPR-associated endonuclease/helicase Cas3